MEKSLRFFSSIHKMLLLREVKIKGEPKPFRFQLFLLENEELLSLMEKWWVEEAVEGKPGHVLGKNCVQSK